MGSKKIEPISHAVDEGAVARLGLVYDVPSPPLDEGRGYKAPAINSATLPSGSQGRHK